MGVQKRKKMSEFLNYKMRVTINDSRIFIGTFMSFDQHKNVILGDCEEFRKIKSNSKSKVEREEKRELGLVVIRGEHVVCMTVEGPPPSEEKSETKVPVGVGHGLPSNIVHRGVGQVVRIPPPQAMAPIFPVPTMLNRPPPGYAQALRGRGRGRGPDFGPFGRGFSRF